METGPQLKVSSDRLVKPGIKHVTPGLQGKWFIHYTTVAPTTYVCVCFSLIIIMTVTCYKIYTPWHEKTCLPGLRNNKRRDLLMHSRSLINTLLEGIISRLATSKISIF